MKIFFLTIVEIIAKAFAAFDNHTKGYSIRKIIAAALTGLVIYAHTQIDDEKILLQAILYDEIFIALLLGIVTIDQIIRFKSTSSQTIETKGKDGESKVEMKQQTGEQKTEA